MYSFYAQEEEMLWRHNVFPGIVKLIPHAPSSYCSMSLLFLRAKVLKKVSVSHFKHSQILFSFQHSTIYFSCLLTYAAFINDLKVDKANGRISVLLFVLPITLHTVGHFPLPGISWFVSFSHVYETIVLVFYSANFSVSIYFVFAPALSHVFFLGSLLSSGGSGFMFLKGWMPLSPKFISSATSSFECSFSYFVEFGFFLFSLLPFNVISQWVCWFLLKNVSWLLTFFLSPFSPLSESYTFFSCLA